jgi:hypothetical protein
LNCLSGLPSSHSPALALLLSYSPSRLLSILRSVLIFIVVYTSIFLLDAERANAYLSNSAHTNKYSLTCLTANEQNWGCISLFARQTKYSLSLSFRNLIIQVELLVSIFNNFRKSAFKIMHRLLRLNPKNSTTWESCGKTVGKTVRNFTIC